MSDNPQRITTWKGKPITDLTEAECRTALAEACALLIEQREQAAQDREMERLFSETAKRLLT